MKISILGGGPAGLYFALLMKRADPGHEICVVERNAPGATFGWGVVFSEETLGSFRDADYESWLAITESFANWDAIEISYRGELQRARGHSFSAIRRVDLLRILQERCRRLGVELSFETEVADPLAQLPEADLVVAADGVNSVTRRGHEDWFEPKVDVYASKFAWFGTDLVFDAFTFIVRETEHGVFQVHAYPFDAQTSTFIVECNQATFDRAGLDPLDEEQGLAFCSELFAEELGGHALKSNRSQWLSFQEVSNKHWWHDNVVLLGDACHTAHWSIGSGTKLAMEDSIALAEAFVRHGPSVPAALNEYETERQPVVERFQQAARTSATYFENLSRYTRFAPVRFAFNLLTRSGRIGYTNLTLRDPRFAQSVDSSFAGGDGNGGADGNGLRIAPPPMFAPLALGPVTLANRVAVSPQGDDASEDGLPTPAQGERVLEAARAGAALVLTEPVAVSLEGRRTSGSPTLHGERQAEAWAGIVERVHEETRALVALQLVHAGARGATRPRTRGVDLPLRDGAWPLVAASARAYGPGSQVPKAMDREDLERVAADFEAAAARAAGAGFDALELNLGQGFLLHGFLSPAANDREDEYGGSLENRMRFPLEVLDRVRAAWPPERLLMARLAGTDWVKRGLTEEDVVAIAAALHDHGCHLIDVVAGQAVFEESPEYRRSYLTPFSDLIRTRAGVPTLVGGYVTTADEVNTTVAAGRADLCLVETALFAPAPTGDRASRPRAPAHA